MSELDELSKAASQTPHWTRRTRPDGGVSSLVPILWVLCVLACLAIAWWLIKEYRQEQAKQQLLNAIEGARRVQQEKFRSEADAVAELERLKREAEQEEKRQRDAKIFRDP